MKRRMTGAVVAALCASTAASAQFVQPELRIDALGPTPYSIEPGAGVNVGLGYYVRAGATAGFNVRSHPASTTGSWRADLLTRVTLDPFRQQRWALSIGGGLSVRPRGTYLAAVVDLEGPEQRGLLPALQVGVSGGVRVGLILRRAVEGRR